MQPGYRIEHYVIVEQAGQGGQATVWSAEDEQLKRMVAVKTINMRVLAGGSGTSNDTQPDSLEVALQRQAERFRTEAQMIADLEHPYILPIYSYGQQDDWLYIIMRYMPGGTLRKLLAQHCLDLSTVIKLAGPIADALDLAHQRQIIHRDIKSANILLDAQQRPYLADFGLSATVADASGTPGAGTLPYMSPEQLMHDTLDHRSDVYSFGIMLYEMFTGSVPPAAGPWNLQQLMSGAPLPIPDDMPEEVAQVLRRATARYPDERYDYSSQIIEDLRGCQPSRAAQPASVRSLPRADPALQASQEAAKLLEAALEKWADGAGRFRLYEEDFQYLDSFYETGDRRVLDFDDAACRLMLRAALEHDYKTDVWWQRVKRTNERRAVALQALSSELPMTRLRALELLADIEDSTPPAIPIRVATIIGKDPDAAVRLAGVKLLAQRGSPSKTWRDVAFTADIDTLLSNLACGDPDPAVSQEAARACGKLRSTRAVLAIAEAATKDNRQASQALVTIRDIVPAFPEGVSRDRRFRTFVTLSRRQLLTMNLIWTYLSGLLAFALPWAVLAYTTFNQDTGTGELLMAQAIGNALASGVLYGTLAALALLAAIEPAQRLLVWTRWSRITLSAVLGGVLTTLLFAGVHTFYYFNPDPPEWAWLIPISVILTLGFAISSGLTRRPWIKAPAGALGVFAAIYISFVLFRLESTQAPILIFLYEDQAFAFCLLFALSLGILSFLPDWLRLAWRRSKTSAT